MAADGPQEPAGSDASGGRAGRRGRQASTPTLRQRAMGALTFFYGSADHRNLPDDERRTTGRDGEDVGDGWHRHGEPGRQYVTRDDDQRL